MLSVLPPRLEDGLVASAVAVASGISSGNGFVTVTASQTGGNGGFGAGGALGYSSTDTIGDDGTEYPHVGGDVSLGGKDWDEKLVGILAERVMAEGGEDPRR